MHTNAIKDTKSLQNRGNKVTQTDYQVKLTALFMSRKSQTPVLFIYLFFSTWFVAGEKCSRSLPISVSHETLVQQPQIFFSSFVCHTIMHH